MELSVVLVIIGLLIGGILAGKSMMASAQNQSVISDWTKYSTAANSYFTKYGYWPGDDYEADRWADIASGGTHAGEKGDGSGYLGGSSASPGDPTVSNSEYFEFWMDIDSAHGNFIGGTYNGSSQLPTTQISGSWMTHYYDSTNPTNQQFYITGSQAVGYAASPGTMILSGNQAYAIDLAIDDGIPTSGTVMGIGATPTNNCYASGVYGTAATSCNLYYVYKK